MFFSTLRQAARDKRAAEQERDFWKERALRLEKKLEDRTDFFVEREFRLIDRTLTGRAKVPAITDEIRAKQLQPETDATASAEALNEYLAEKKQNLIDMALEAGLPAERGAADFERNRDRFIMDYQQGMAGLIG
jgi:hypothetical protein